MDPNFPPNLDIKPSIHRNTLIPAHASFDLHAQERAIQKYGIAGRVWEAAYAMTSYVSPDPQFENDPPFLPPDSSHNPITMLELGAGTGMLSAYIATVLDPSKDVLVVTDLPEVCPLLEDNLSALIQNPHSAHSCVSVRPLSWGNRQDVLDLEDTCLKERSLTHVICSDLVYFPELLGPLLRTLIHLTSSNTYDDLPPTVIISYKIRSLLKESPFWSAFGLWFEFVPVLQRKRKEHESWHHIGSDFDDKTFIFVARRRPQSYSWVVPPEDESLLRGVGAYGKQTRQSDDTFELILLMTMGSDIIE